MPFIIYTGHLVLLQQTHKGAYDRLNIHFIYWKQKIIQSLAGKQLENQPLTIPKILEKCITMGLRETGCENMNLM
jgi:hypothetical protein